MRLIERLICLGLFFILVVLSPASASLIPSTNLALSLESDESIYPVKKRVIFTYLEEEMRLKGFMGRIRRVEDGAEEETNGETSVRIVITRNEWFTRKLLSVPYLLNRYRREYVLETFVEIPEGKNGMSIKRISASSFTRTVTQYANNDKYDPAIFPNQSEELIMKENTGRELAKKLAEHLFKQLK